jgi:hypothetical protein
MYKIILLFFAVGLFSCEEGANLEQESIIAEGRLINQLPADGCDWHFVFDNEKFPNHFAFSDESKKLVQPFIDNVTLANGLPQVKVKVTYTLTDKKKRVQCGWGATNDMDELTVIGIEKL